MSKSPLYKNLIPSSAGRSPSFGYGSPASSLMSPKMHSNSGWYQNSPASQKYQSPIRSPSVNLNRSSIYDQPNMNNSVGGLEVHGSYFINKSLLHSNLVEDETFSLVNSNFNSPRQISTNMAAPSNDSLVQK